MSQYLARLARRRITLTECERGRNTTWTDNHINGASSEEPHSMTEHILKVLVYTTHLIFIVFNGPYFSNTKKIS